jgi:NADPH:quinone reductase-like Zn-dependent oxidoreductase
VQLAKAMGAEVTASTSARNADFVGSLGADHVIDYATTDLAAAPERFALFFDVFGNRPFARARAALRPGGRYVTTVPSPRIVAERIFTSFASRQARLVVVRSRRADLEQLLDFVDAGQLVPIIHSVVSLEDTAQGHAQLETKRTRGKVIVRID